MPTRVEARVRGLGRASRICCSALALLGSAASAAAQRGRAPQCRRAVVEGAVHAGKGFQVEFARGLVFGLEPIASGWAVRVVAANKPRGPHDYAEVATLPYQSVSPLLLSTDWAFRAQDAVGWTPRRFRYAANETAYRTLAGSFDAVLRGDPKASARAAALASSQPEGLLEIRDAKLAPGMADQTRMAAAVSARFSQTPHNVDTSAPPSPLGRMLDVRFRASLDLPMDVQPAAGADIVRVPCDLQPTDAVAIASHDFSKRTSP